MNKEKKEKKEKKPKEEKTDTTFADLVSKITVTNDTPHGLLKEWQEKFGIDNCYVVPKLK